ncbi:MAG: DUF790 family protein [Pyrinomonadaceae bacterium]
MLTSDLALNLRRGDKILPRLIRTDDAGYSRDAETLIEIFEEFQGRTRGDLEKELEDYVGTGTDYRILRGLIKLLTDRSEFETHAPAEPVEIRRKVFLEARKFQSVTPDSENKQTVLEITAEEFGTDANAIFNNLYADLSAQQQLTKFETIAPEDLLDLYNLAQAQAILYKCVEMKIVVAPSDAANYRAIFGWIKHFGLIHSVAGNSKTGYEITLTGAASLFHRSQKYGIQMSVFLPALLLCKNWKFRAEIAQKQGGNLFYELTSEQIELISNRYDEPEYKNPDIEKLTKNWEKFATDWRLETNRKVIDLGKTAFIPDLVLVSPENKEIYLDILGFWTPKSLQKRLAEFEAANYKNFIIAASNDLRGSREEPLWTSENVIFYKTKIEPRVLIETAETLLNI